MKKGRFRDFVELRKVFPHADLVGPLVVFNVGGNKVRLIAAVHFNRGKIYIREILNHTDYDKGGWKK
jgi:mRNA interferase HigB